MFRIRQARGFTLIELLVVIAIIGILSSVVLASLNTARQKSRDARRIADVKQIQLALELFYDSNASYPTTTLSALVPAYISVLPKDPTNGDSYTYVGIGSSSSVCTSYHVGTSLEQSGHSALGSDADAAVVASISCGTFVDFSGADSGKCATGDVGSSCYDVKP